MGLLHVIAKPFKRSKETESSSSSSITTSSDGSRTLVNPSISDIASVPRQRQQGQEQQHNGLAEACKAGESLQQQSKESDYSHIKYGASSSSYAAASAM
ncbi:hypothetical protein ACM66B_006767 [Microbotryomycetes sp. NB124-2]